MLYTTHCRVREEGFLWWMLRNWLWQISITMMRIAFYPLFTYIKKNLKSIHPLGNPLAFSSIFQKFFVHKRRKSYTVGPLHVKRNKLPRLVAGQKQPPFCFVKHLNNFYKCQNCGKCVKVWGVSFETFTKLFLDFWLIGGWFCPVTNLVAHVFWGATPPLWYQKESFL